MTEGQIIAIFTLIGTGVGALIGALATLGATYLQSRTEAARDKQKRELELKDREIQLRRDSYLEVLGHLMEWELQRAVDPKGYLDKQREQLPTRLRVTAGLRVYGSQVVCDLVAENLELFKIDEETGEPIKTDSTALTRLSAQIRKELDIN